MEKDKKKKLIISMVVAVTFLVILIVGATYAYFQASNTANGTTNLSAETTEIGNVIITNPTENLYLKLSAYEMQESKKGTSYGAIAEKTSGKTAYSTSYVKHTIAQAQVVGGSSNSNYKCSFKMNVTKPSVIKSGDMAISIDLRSVYSSPNIEKILFNNTSYDSFMYDIPFDLYELPETNTVTFNIQGGTDEIYDLLKVALYIYNSSSNQNHLIGQDLGISISLSDLECNVVDGISFYAYDANNNLIKTYYKGVVNIEEDRSGGPEYYLSDVYKVVIPEGITKIGRSVFANNSLLTNVTIPNGVTTIGSNAFDGTGLTSLHIPASVTSIGSLGTINNLTTLTVDENNTAYESKNNALIEKENQKLISVAKGITSIPEGIKIIGTSSLTGLSLSSLTIPSSVETIENAGFSFVTISEIVFGDGLKTIGERAFEYNMSLQSIVLPKSLTSIGSEAFWSTNGLTINYRGSEEEWNAIEKASDWNMAASGYTIVYNYTG